MPIETRESSADALTRQDSRDSVEGEPQPARTLLLRLRPLINCIRFLVNLWFRFTAPPLTNSAGLYQREAARRGRLTSAVLLFVILIITLLALPVGIFGPNHILAPAMLFLTIVMCIALAFNRRGQILVSGGIVVAGIDLGLAFALLTTPGGLNANSLPLFDLMVQSELVAVSLLPVESVFIVAACNCVFIWLDLALQPHAPSLTAVLTMAGPEVPARPIVLQIILAVVLYLWIRNAQQDAARANEAEIQKRLHEQAAETDPITGLPNHRAIMNRLNEVVSKCQHDWQTCTFLFMDLDHFKHVNDSWGHRAGDAILREVGQRVYNTLRRDSFIGRYGGEEFAIALPHIDLTNALLIAERVRETIAVTPCIWHADDSNRSIAIPVTASIGIAVYGLHGMTCEALIESADQAMYRAKQNGRNRVCVAGVDEEEPQQPATATNCPRNAASRQEQEMVQMLLQVAQFHDRNIGEHSQRMVELVEATAHAMELPATEIHLACLGALLHDIGKIGVPDAILHKPGPLTSEEWAIMRLHPEMGQRILLQASDTFAPLADVVVAHHERWDGCGYPAQLAGEQIPLAARILAVADAFDAITSRRSYKEALSVETAREELIRGAGSQFDPEVVKAFLQLLDEQRHNTSAHQEKPVHFSLRSA